jgi:hypothetical protein
MQCLQGVATAEDIDTAMEKGSRLIKGPLKLADYVGVPLSADRMDTICWVHVQIQHATNRYLCGPAANHCSCALILSCCLVFPLHHVPSSSNTSHLLGILSIRWAFVLDVAPKKLKHLCTGHDPTRRPCATMPIFQCQEAERLLAGMFVWTVMGGHPTLDSISGKYDLESSPTNNESILDLPLNQGYRRSAHALVQLQASTRA